MHRLSFIYGVVVALHFHLRFENGVNFDGSQAMCGYTDVHSLEGGMNGWPYETEKDCHLAEK